MTSQRTDPPPSFKGTWRITETEVWGPDVLDLVGPPYVALRQHGMGTFRFIAVEGDMDCRFGERDGEPLVEFSWSGFDDGEPVSGRGWAIAQGDELSGRLFFHHGEESDFRAKRDDGLTRTAPTARGRSRRRRSP